MEIIFKHNFRMEWKAVTYQKQPNSLPSQRWGHRLVKTNTNQLVLFGGFGGSSNDGVYLSDLWTFSTSTHSWQQLQTQGQVPQNRSNYTLHYNSVSDQIILYGGGSHNRTRFNSVCILDWKTKVWTQYMPEEATEAPWERTYHTSEFCYPYLIVHGGQGVANLDLDDMWVFNVIDKKWKQIGFDAAGVPRKRRFHSSALIGSYLYIMGGCTGNFQLLGDMHCVNLASLFERQAYDNFHWETVVRKDKLLERWGHSSEVYNGIIYTSCGRISPSQDSCDTFTFDSRTKTLARVQVESGDILPRRRQASAIVGNSLLLFGGYNGKYLNDFHYLPLDGHMSVQKSTKLEKVMFETLQEMECKLKEYQSKYEADLTIEAKANQASFSLKTNKNKLKSNPFMNNLLKYTQEEQPIIQLPEFCDLTTFRLLHSAIIEKQLIIYKHFSMESLASLIKSNQYFICCEANSVIEAHLIEIVDQANCLEILQMAIQFNLINAQKAAAKTYLSLKEEDHDQKKAKLEVFMRSKHFLQAGSPEQDSRDSNNTKDSLSTTSSILEQVYEHIKFDLQQQKLKDRHSNIFEKAAKHFKFALGRSNSKSQSAKGRGKDEKQQGCFARLTNFLSGIFMSAKVHHE